VLFFAADVFAGVLIAIYFHSENGLGAASARSVGWMDWFLGVSSVTRCSNQPRSSQLQMPNLL